MAGERTATESTAGDQNSRGDYPVEFKNMSARVMHFLWGWYWSWVKGLCLQKPFGQNPCAKRLSQVQQHRGIHFIHSDSVSCVQCWKCLPFCSGPITAVNCSTRHADTKQTLARAVQKVPRAGTVTVQTPTQPGTWVAVPHAGSTNPSFQKNIFGEHWWQEECSRAGLLSLLAPHWFKAFGMKHSESLSLLLCKNYTDMITPDGSWCYFSFVKSLLPISNTKRLKSVVHQMRWKWGLGSGALTRMRKGCSAVESVPSGQPCVATQVYLLLQMPLSTKHNMSLVCTAFAQLGANYSKGVVKIWGRGNVV